MTVLSEPEIRSIIKEMVASIKDIPMPPQEIPDDAPLFDWGLDESSPIGLDSIDGLELALALSERFDLDFEEDTKPENVKTVGMITSLVVETLRQRQE